MRQKIITTRLLKQFCKVMPAMSRTEREALEAGSIWWDAELFSGRPNWEKLLNTPRPHLSEREQAFLDGPVENLCEILDDWKITHEDRDLPPDVWDFIKREGFFGLIIPEEYGGLGFSALAHSEVVMKLSSRSIVAAVTVMVPNSLGPGKLLLHYGTPAQRDYYLPRLARGEDIPCFALTGPDAGSDAGALPDSGVVTKGQWRGKTVLGVRLNWEKRYITLGPVATIIGLAFRLHDPEHLLGTEEDLGITLALVPRDTPGVTIGARHIPIDIPFQNGPNWGKDVFIPMSQLIGEQQYIGKGWRMLVESLAEGRGISLPALSVGAAKVSSRYTGAYAAIRQQFNMPIGRFEGIQAGLRPRERFWDIPVHKIDSAFDNLLVPQPSWSPSTTQQLRKLVAAPYLTPNDCTPRLDAYFASPLALCARRVSSAASRLLGSTTLRFALHGWQRLPFHLVDEFSSDICSKRERLRTPL